MTRETNSRLAQAIAAVQYRWGPQALNTSGQIAEHNGYVSTSFPDLDATLGGGIPRGRITTISGQPTSGRRTLALHTLKQVQQGNRLAVYLDLQHTFDPEYAAHCGLDLAHVLVVRPEHWGEALMILQALVHTGEADTIILDNVDVFGHDARSLQRFVDTLCRLLSSLAATRCALICLSTDADVSSGGHFNDALSHLATVRLHLAQERWLQEHNDVLGYEARVSVLKHKRAAAMSPTILTIPLPAV